MISRISCVLVWLLINVTAVHAQLSVANLDLDKDIEQWYQKQIGQNNTPIANGAYYRIEAQTPSQHQFLESPIWDIGTVIIQGQRFDSVRLLYNLFDDLLIVENSGVYRSNFQPIEPNQKAVDAFITHDRYFVNVESDSISEGPGFYEMVYDGDNLNLLSKRSKLKTVNEREVQYFQEQHFFIQIGESFYRYKNKRTLYDLFPDHKKQIRSFAQRNSNGMSRRSPNSIYNLALYCEQFVSNHE